MSPARRQSPPMKGAAETVTAVPEEAVQKAWVVFSGQADLPWLRVLRRGFRHCFVVIHDGVSWVTVDPMLHRMDVAVHHQLPQDFDLPLWLKSRGNTVVPAPCFAGVQKPAPAGLFTCVEAVKRVLGLRARFILTPWQLYCHLNRHQFLKS